METVLLAVHIVLVSALVLVILLQRSGNDGLSGLGGGGGNAGGNSIFSVRGSANFLTRITSFLATGFICSSLALAYIASHRDGGTSLADKIAAEKPTAPVQAPMEAAPAAPEVPLAE